MAELSFIQKIYEEFKTKGDFGIPPELLPPERGYLLIRWVRELFIHYDTEGIVARALDDLPTIKLSTQPGLNLSLQDIHKFIISDQNLIPLENKKKIIEFAIGLTSTGEAWHHIISILLSQFKGLNREMVQEEVSWKFSPSGEALWVLTWFFMEREAVEPPQSNWLICHRFPYYLWSTDGKGENSLRQSLWEPDNPFCRWEWLASDLFYSWINNHKNDQALSID